MRDLAVRAVLRAKEHGWEIVVGDAAGIDKAVIDACCANHIRFRVYGITELPRNICCLEHQKRWYKRVRNGGYLARDRYMCACADRCFAIWNGISKGTIYTYNHMLKLGKLADLRNFGKEVKDGNW